MIEVLYPEGEKPTKEVVDRTPTQKQNDRAKKLIKDSLSKPLGFKEIYEMVELDQPHTFIASEVQEIVNEIDAELNPPPKVEEVSINPEE